MVPLNEAPSDDDDDDDVEANSSDEEDEGDSSSVSSKGDPDQPDQSPVRSKHWQIYDLSFKVFKKQTKKHFLESPHRDHSMGKNYSSFLLTFTDSSTCIYHGVQHASATRGFVFLTGGTAWS